MASDEESPGSQPTLLQLTFPLAQKTAQAVTFYLDQFSGAGQGDLQPN